MIKKMRIGIDISTLLNHGRDIGAGRYMLNLIKSMFEIDSEDTFIFTGRYITDEHLYIIDELKTCYHEIHEISKTTKKSTLTKVSGPDKISGYSKKVIFKLFKTTQKRLDVWNNINFPAIELLGFKTDIFHCPDFLIPPTLNNNIILTIHDLAFMRFPQFNFEWFIKKYSKEVRRNAEIASRIIAVSNSTRNDIIKFFNIYSSKIDVIYEAADDSFRKINDKDLDHNILDKYNINGSFILSVGTIEPRKNYVTLIRAYNLLKNRHSDFRWKLVIAGRTGWMSESVYEEYEKSPYKSDIIFTGRMNDHELVNIYNLAELFVYPSIFEGFGLPVVEAMKCGLPVIASDTSSIPEIIENKDLLFNPADEKEIADKIINLQKNEKLRKELSKKSVINAEKFSWKKTAQETLETYKKSLEKGSKNKIRV